MSSSRRRGWRGQVRETDVPYGAGEIPPPSPSPRQKLVLFTEHRDTLRYLQKRIATLLGREQAVVVIHGGIGREERLAVQEAFRHDPDVQVLLATDAAGEGINLQRAHLMVNYDLPWNPNRLEQRFGRIHRIGQTEVCHLWNLVADDTRGGRRLPAAAREAGASPADARRPGVRRARGSWSSRGGLCASCCSTPSGTASGPKCGRGSTPPSTHAF